MRTALALLLLLAPLASAQVTTTQLRGRYDVEVTRTNVGRTLQPGAQLTVSTTGRITLTLDGQRVRIARVGDTLLGRIPGNTGIAGGIPGAPRPAPTTLALRIEGTSASDLRLVGTIRSVRERTSLRLTRQGAVPRELLVERARAYVMKNATTDATPDATFPAVDSGEDGLHAYLLDGAAGDRLVAFTKAWFSGDAAVQAFRLDRARQVVVAVRTTFDEEGLFCAVLDRATGQGRLLGQELGVVDLSYTLDQATLDRLVPGMGDIEDVDHMDLIDRLVEGGASIDLTAEGFALRHWGAPAERVRFFRSEEEWRDWYDATPGGPTGKWAYLSEDEADTATFVLGQNDLWVQEVRVTRATGAVEVVGEH